MHEAYNNIGNKLQENYKEHYNKYDKDNHQSATPGIGIIILNHLTAFQSGIFFINVAIHIHTR